MNFHLKHATNMALMYRLPKQRSMHEKISPLISKGKLQLVRYVQHAILPGWRKQHGSGWQTLFQHRQYIPMLFTTTIKLTHSYRTTVANTRFFQTGQPHVMLYSNTQLSDNFYYIPLTYAFCTTVANARFHKKGQVYKKKLSENVFWVPYQIPSNPNKSPYLYTGIPINCLLTEALI